MSDEHFDYDEGVDHLTIYKGGPKIVRNVDTGFVIVSLGAKREVVGLEFMGAHKNFHIPLDILKNMSGGKVEIRYSSTKKRLIVNLTIQYKKRERPIVYSSDLDLGNVAFTETFACSAS